MELPTGPIVFVDFEFHQPTGELPTPICCVTRTWPDGRELRLDEAELRACRVAPFPLDASTLYVGYAAAELGCHLVLGWKFPISLIDLHFEFKASTNGRQLPAGHGLLGAAHYYGLETISGNEKDDKRGLAIRGGPFTAAERTELLDYCASDVRTLEALWWKMLPELSAPHALLRGRYAKAQARMEAAGVPIDVPTLARLRASWDAIKGQLIATVDQA
jgi:hypothetical protein